MTISNCRLRFLLALLLVLFASGNADSATLEADGDSLLRDPVGETVPAGTEFLEKVRDVRRMHESELMGLPEVIGTGVGLGCDNRPVILLLLQNGVAEGAIPTRIDGVPVMCLVTGRISHLSLTGETASRENVDFVGMPSESSKLLSRVGRYGRGAEGLLEGIDVTVDVAYGFRTVRLEGQILVSSWEPFVWDGGGGALLVSERGGHPVGVIRAGNVTGRYSFAVPVSEGRLVRE